MNNLYRLLRCAAMLAVMMTIPTVMSGALPDTTTVNGTHLYKIDLAKNNSGSQYLSTYFITPSSPKVSIKDNPGTDELWYILETDDTPTGTFTRDHIEHYCYIVNAVSGQYLYYTGTDSNEIETNVVEMKDINALNVENDRFKFIIKKSGNDATYNCCMYPKIAAENNTFSGNTNLWESNSYGFLALGIPQNSTYANDITLSKERNGTWTSQWVFVSSPLLTEPTITFDDGTNSFSISHDILSSGCTIYYTTDGSTPSTASTPYTGPVNVNASETVRAVVIRDYDNISLTEVGSLEVAPVAVAAPTVTNNYDGTISLSSTTPNAKIYYTTDNTTPSSSHGTLYTTAFSLGNATVIKAITYNSDLSESSTVTIYDVPKYTTPTISFNSGTSEVTITCAGATGIYYTTDGGTPTTSSTAYSAPFTVSSDATTVKAIATHAGYLNSEVATWTNDYSQKYLTFTVITGGTIPWKSIGSGMAKEISYRINGGSWESKTAGSDVTISVNVGDIVEFKGNNEKYAKDKNNYSAFYEGSATYDAEGNIMSLIYGDNFSRETTLEADWALANLFNYSKLVSAENLIMPATTLTKDCYRGTFANSPNLTTPPALPATTLASECYYYMFDNCAALTTAPHLQATILANSCYYGMFHGCSSLNYILCLAVDKSAPSCLSNWVDGVSPTGTFVKDENATWSTGASGIPTGWVVNDHLAAPIDPLITCDGEFIIITCDTYGADIYFRFGTSGEFTPYESPISIISNVTVQAYAEKNGLRSNTVAENCIAIKTYNFAGMELTPGPLYYGSNGYEIKEDWNDVSYNSIYGKTVGSTYFNFIELGQLFESSVFSTTDGDIEKVLDPLDGWRVPTYAEWASILGTTRSGSTINDAPNKHYAMIQLTGVTHAGSSTPSGLLIFPDGETISGVELSNMDNATPNTGITESQLNDYLSQGCIFLPGSGSYDGGWGNGLYYWSSTENNSSTGYVSSGDSQNKESCYLPVYLVKGAADEATKLLRTWTYNNNEVELPYSVNAIDGHSANYKKSTFTFTTDVKIKVLQPTYLWFQHADQSAAVYVDNTLVEKHWGGYNAFFVDLSGHVHLGTNNIKVVLNNNEGKHLAPYDGDFNFNATLGEVKLISSPAVPSPDYGYDGFHITSIVTPSASDTTATITVTTVVPTNATLTCSIIGKNCNYSNTQTGTDTIRFTTTITNPHLWNGTSDPYLYDVTLTIAKDGVVYHQFKRGYGFRFYEYVIDENTPKNSRFMLNGSPYFLRGVCMHNDLEGKANALTAEDIDNDFEILKELGCNFVRLAHYPHPKEVYDWCDRLGIIVQTEVPWVNRAESDYPSDYYTHLVGQYKDMVNQHYNHPCILFWGLANEIKPTDKEFVKEKIEQYADTIKKLDRERLVGFVMSHSYNTPTSFGSPNVDWFGCNDYVGWYADKESNDPTSRLNTRQTNFLKNGKKPFALSEYGCGGNNNCHSEKPKITTTKGTSTSTDECYRHDIEYLMWLHEGHIAAIRKFPQLLFTSVWQLFDIAVSSRHEGYTLCYDGLTTSTEDAYKSLNNKGLVERDHRTKKDPFYLYKAWWNQDEKFVHICGKNYERVTQRVIKCYTNDGIIISNDTILRLFVNNEGIGTAKVKDNIATFEATDFEPGDVIRVEGATTSDTFTFPEGCTVYDHIFQKNGDWNVATNWNTNTVPTAESKVLIMADATIPSGTVARADVVFVDSEGSLTIEDGGQLYHSNEGTIATVKKAITRYTVEHTEGVNKTNGWYFISLPITDSIAPDKKMTSNNYDLFRLNPTTNTWENYKKPEQKKFKKLVNGRGYLYANNNDVTLSFTGKIKPYDANYTVGSTGWNLVGNPYTFNAYVNQSHYTLNDTRDAIVAATSNNAPIAPCTGVLVEDEATFYNEAVSLSNNNGCIQMTLAQTIATRGNSNVETLDNAIVSFNEGSQLGKFYFGTQNANIYIPQDDKEFAIVSSEAQGEIPVNFNAHENGTYTLTVNVEDVEMGYLHLIDNMTGTDIDLLSTPSYTFSAMSDDYTSRFRLVFIAHDADIYLSDDFAFFSNGNWIIANEGKATLQVIDINGRVISSETINGTFSKSLNVANGVYVLQLVNGENVKTQKIVIR